MFQNFFSIFNKEIKLIQNINFQIVNQSRKKELYILFSIEDTFQNRLNFQILHLALILINISYFKKKHIFEKKILKAFLNNFDLDFREQGYGDKLIEKKIFEISNLINYQFIQYKKSFNNKILLRNILNKFFKFYNLDNKTIFLEKYIHKQNIYIRSLKPNKLLNKNIFLDWK
jgi:Uncharacterized conserved protein